MVEFAQVSDDPKIRIAYETFGDPSDPVLFLVAGLGAQMVSFDKRFCEALAPRGVFVVRFDNRDVGESTWLDESGTPDLVGVLSGDTRGVPYTLDDMATDVVGLADAIGVKEFHLCGVSMGAMICQIAASDQFNRVLSFTQISSTTGSPLVGQTTDEVVAALLTAAPDDEAGFLESYVAFERLIGSPDPVFDPERAIEKGREVFARGVHRDGTLRQAAAMLATGDRTERLAQIVAPTYVIHGDADPMVNVSGGHATRDAITNPRADVRYEEIEGMGHDLPMPQWARLIEHLVINISRGEALGIVD